jgi:hypothetical protein
MMATDIYFINALVRNYTKVLVMTIKCQHRGVYRNSTFLKFAIKMQKGNMLPILSNLISYDNRKINIPLKEEHINN